MIKLTTGVIQDVYVRYTDGPEIHRVADPEDRAILEAELRLEIFNRIANARAGIRLGGDTWNKRYNAMILLQCLTHTNPAERDMSNSFAGLKPERGHMLGDSACHNIGIQACAEMEFTAEEACQILENTPFPNR